MKTFIIKVYYPEHKFREWVSNYRDTWAAVEDAFTRFRSSGDVLGMSVKPAPYVLGNVPLPTDDVAPLQYCGPPGSR